VLKTYSRAYAEAKRLPAELDNIPSLPCSMTDSWYADLITYPNSGDDHVTQAQAGQSEAKRVKNAQKQLNTASSAAALDHATSWRSRCQSGQL